MGTAHRSEATQGNPEKYPEASDAERQLVAVQGQGTVGTLVAPDIAEIIHQVPGCIQGNKDLGVVRDARSPVEAGN